MKPNEFIALVSAYVKPFAILATEEYAKAYLYEQESLVAQQCV